MTQSFSDWFYYMLNNTNKESMQIITTITYTIWFARNQKVFQHQDIPVQLALPRALKLLHEYHHNINDQRLEPKTSSHPSFASNDKSWSPPPRNCLKLNVDAHLQDDGHWGLGMVLRRDDGRCVGAATRVIKGSNDVGLAETAGLKEALNLIQAMELDEVIVEMDAAVIVNAIHNKIFPRNQWGLLARECSRAFDLNNKLSLKWVSREGNHAAHSLARWAFTEPNKWWSNYFPDCINHHIQKDMAFVT
ncbi:uncharacterized protein LOC123894954 [Trifolium pratense]|nr:uncharacterized protein LOC123894954 [Trifolium pratense]CAJ2651829.1 unnamed protein product [Trifolium pratense]